MKKNITKKKAKAVPLYRILNEVDDCSNLMQSIAIYNTNTEKIEKWVGNFREACEYVDENGKLAVLDY